MTDQNGSAPLVPHAAGIVEQLRALIREREQALAHLDVQRQGIQAELKAYEQAIKPLIGGTAKKPKPSTPAAKTGTKIGEQRIEELKDFIRRFAEDHEEFRQVDVRAAMGRWADGATVSSAITATAFERLRQEPYNFLRIGRVDGNSKFYRLTREAARTP